MKKRLAPAVLAFLLGLAASYLFTHGILVSVLISQLCGVVLAVCGVYRIIKKPDTVFAAGLIAGILAGIFIPL